MWTSKTANDVRQWSMIDKSDLTPTEKIIEKILLIANVDLWECVELHKEIEKYSECLCLPIPEEIDKDFNFMQFDEFIYLETQRKTKPFEELNFYKNENCTAGQQVYLANKYAEFCEFVMLNYGSLFESEESARSSIGSSATWTDVLFGLSDGDIYKSERISQMPLLQVLRWLIIKKRESQRQI